MSQDDVFQRLEKLDKSLSDLLTKIDQIQDAMLLYCDGLDAVDTQLRRNIGGNPFKAQTLEQKMQPLEVRLPDLSKLSWTIVPAHDYVWEGQNKHTDAYEKSLDKEKPEFQGMVKLIESKGGRPMFNGGFMVWFDQKDGSLGRRARKR